MSLPIKDLIKFFDNPIVSEKEVCQNENVEKNTKHRIPKISKEKINLIQKQKKEEPKTNKESRSVLKSPLKLLSGSVFRNKKK